MCICLHAVRYVSQGPQAPSPVPGFDQNVEDEAESDPKSRSGRFRISPTIFKMFESAATTFASITILGLAGYSYHRYYKWLVLHKMEKAFRPGDPALKIAGEKTRFRLPREA